MKYGRVESGIIMLVFHILELNLIKDKYQSLGLTLLNAGLVIFSY